jgi:hypothetical protein
MGEPPSLTPAACYRAVCKAWSAYTDLKNSITLPYLPSRRSRQLLSMCQSMNLNKVSCLFTVIFNEFKKHHKVHLLFHTRRNYRT